MRCSVNIGTSLHTYSNAACRCMLQVMLYLAVGLHHLVLVPMPVQHSHHPLWETIISVNVDAREDQWYPDDPLRDGDGCPTGNTCCDHPSLPWFNRMIDEPSTADIELRLCRDEAATNEDLSVELFELYVY